jgi:hypothetical protein
LPIDLSQSNGKHISSFQGNNSTRGSKNGNKNKVSISTLTSPASSPKGYISTNTYNYLNNSGHNNKINSNVARTLSREMSSNLTSVTGLTKASKSTSIENRKRNNNNSESSESPLEGSTQSSVNTLVPSPTTVNVQPVVANRIENNVKNTNSMVGVTPSNLNKNNKLRRGTTITPSFLNEVVGIDN